MASKLTYSCSSVCFSANRGTGVYGVYAGREDDEVFLCIQHYHVHSSTPPVLMNLENNYFNMRLLTTQKQVITMVYDHGWEGESLWMKDT